MNAITTNTRILLTVTAGTMQCSYEYKRQPGSGRTNESCSSLGGSQTPLKLGCQVSGIANFTIQWHYSPSPPTENSTTTTATNICNYDQLDIHIVQGPLSMPGNMRFDEVSWLTISGFDIDKVAGYYWCSVNSSSNFMTPNPSQVLHISPLCFLGSTDYMSMEQEECSTLNLFEVLMSPNNRCADFSESIDIVNASCQMDDEGKTSAPTDSYTKQGSTPTLGITDFDAETTIMTNGQVSNPDQLTSQVSDPDQSTGSPSKAFPMHFIWMIVGIVFAILFGIIVIMLIIIVYLTRKRNRIKGIQQTSV